MQIQKVQNKNSYNSNFKGLIKVQNLQKGEKVIERKTSLECDMGLSCLAQKNLFNNNWANEGSKQIQKDKLLQYLDVMGITLGIKIHRSAKNVKQIELKHLGTGYTVKTDSGYEITHIHDDFRKYK